MEVRNFNRENLEYFKEHVNRLTPESERQFGTLDVVGMMHHLRNAFETAAGDVTVEDKSVPIVRTAAFYIVCYVMTTWPGGAIKAPDYWTPSTDNEFDEEHALFLKSMDRFCDMLEEDPTGRAANPVLGPLTRLQWSRLMGVHCKHHLRQFSVT